MGFHGRLQDLPKKSLDKLRQLGNLGKNYNAVISYIDSLEEDERIKTIAETFNGIMDGSNPEMDLAINHHADSSLQVRFQALSESTLARPVSFMNVLGNGQFISLRKTKPLQGSKIVAYLPECSKYWRGYNNRNKYIFIKRNQGRENG